MGCAPPAVSETRPIAYLRDLVELLEHVDGATRARRALVHDRPLLEAQRLAEVGLQDLLQLRAPSAAAPSMRRGSAAPPPTPPPPSRPPRPCRRPWPPPPPRGHRASSAANERLDDGDRAAVDRGERERRRQVDLDLARHDAEPTPAPSRRRRRRRSRSRRKRLSNAEASRPRRRARPTAPSPARRRARLGGHSVLGRQRVVRVVRLAAAPSIAVLNRLRWRDTDASTSASPAPAARPPPSPRRAPPCARSPDPGSAASASVTSPRLPAAALPRGARRARGSSGATARRTP